MNKREEIKSRRRITAVDIMIALLLVLCIVGIVVRIVIGDSGFFTGNNKGEYMISYVISDKDDEYSQYFTEGKEFFLESGEKFGTLNADALVTPAEFHSENDDGEYVISLSQNGTVDYKGTAIVTGSMTDSGFLLNSSTYIAPNMTITVSSSDITVELLITNITVASK